MHGEMRACCRCTDGAAAGRCEWVGQPVYVFFCFEQPSDSEDLQKDYVKAEE